MTVKDLIELNTMITDLVITVRKRWVNNRFVFWSCPTFEEYKTRK